jgi:hypothetical protein
MKPHSLCTLFPEITGPDFDALVADIKENGLLNPIITLDDQILDGRNRFNACLAAGVPARFEPFTGKDALAYVTSQNLNRRHLDASQRSMLAAEILMKSGKSCDQSANLHSLNAEQIAAQLNVSRRSVFDAKTVAEHSPTLAKKVKSGKISLNKAKQSIMPKKSKKQPAATILDTPQSFKDSVKAEDASKQGPQNSQPEPLTLISYQKALQSLHDRIPQNKSDQTKFGTITNTFASTQINWKPAGATFNPYA